MFSIIQAAASVTGVQGISPIKNISVFPNPNNGMFTLSIESATTQKINANIFNSLGQLILRKETEIDTQTEFDLSGNAKGIYYLQFFADERYYYKRLLFE